MRLILLLLLTLNIYSETINSSILPPEPDSEIINVTLRGIDSNNNGARDDVVPPVITLNGEQNTSFSQGEISKKPVELVLTSYKKDFVSQRDDGTNTFHRAELFVKVIATFGDDSSEEVTDFVTWNYDKNLGIEYKHARFYVPEGNFTLSASFDGITSNLLNITHRYDKDSLLKTKESFYYDHIPHKSGEGLKMLDLKLVYPPTSAVDLLLKLRDEDKVSFLDGGSEYKVTFDINDTSYINVILLLKDINLTEEIVVITEPLKSDDSRYDRYDPKDISLERVAKLREPLMIERQGAIRGTHIAFKVLPSREESLEYELLNPPKGMRIIPYNDRRLLHTDEGLYIEWDVPMDAQEGKEYSVNVKATDRFGNVSTLNFAITVPRTAIIPTKLENNELTVIDQNSPLYGMKMKGYTGEDISNVELRSVAYKDVWKYIPKNEIPDSRSKILNTVFIIYNKPPKLDINLSDDISHGLYKHKSGSFFDFYFWRSIAPQCTVGPEIERWDGKTGTFIEWINSNCIPRPNSKMYDDGGNKVYLLQTDK